MYIIMINNQQSLISMTIFRYFLDLTHFRGQGRNLNKKGVPFWRDFKTTKSVSEILLTFSTIFKSIHLKNDILFQSKLKFIIKNKLALPLIYKLRFSFLSTLGSYPQSFGPFLMASPFKGNFGSRRPANQRYAGPQAGLKIGGRGGAKSASSTLSSG